MILSFLLLAGAGAFAYFVLAPVLNGFPPFTSPKAAWEILKKRERDKQ